MLIRGAEEPSQVMQCFEMTIIMMMMIWILMTTRCRNAAMMTLVVAIFNFLLFNAYLYMLYGM